MHTERMFFMKKLLSVLLVLAMVVSCIAVVQMTSFAASEETIVDENFENFDASSKPGLYQNLWGETVTVVDEGGSHNKVMKFTSVQAWRAPSWNIGAKAQEIYNNRKNASDTVTLRISFDIKAVKAGSQFRATMREKNTGNTGVVGVVENVGTEWKTFSYIYEYTTDKSKYNNFTIDNLNNSNDGYFIDNLKIVAVTGAKETVNGNVENGSIGWSVFSQAGGATSVVEGGANNTAHAIKFKPAQATQWGNFSSVAFSVGATIINDAANGYAGKGANKYKMSFYAKAADASKGGAFNIYINSQCHMNKGAKVGELEVKENTYQYIGEYTMTGEWTKFEKEFEISASFLETLKDLYNAGKTNAYDLILRVCGNGKAFKEATFEYLIDEVTIEPVEDATPTPGDAATPTPGEDAAPTPTPKRATGVKVTFNDDVTFADPTAMFFNTNTNGGVTSAADIKNNQITKTFKIKNHGEETIGVVVRLQATVKKSDGNPTWAGNPDKNDMVEIEPGKVGTVTITVPVKDGKVTILEQEVPVEKLFARFDVTGEGGACELPKGTSFTIFCDEEVADTLTKSWVSNSDKLTRELSYESLDSNSSSNGDVLPVAFITIAVVAAAVLVVVTRKRKFNA